MKHGAPHACVAPDDLCVCLKLGTNMFHLIQASCQQLKQTKLNTNNGYLWAARPNMCSTDSVCAKSRQESRDGSAQRDEQNNDLADLLDGAQHVAGLTADLLAAQ